MTQDAWVESMLSRGGDGAAASGDIRRGRIDVVGEVPRRLETAEEAARAIQSFGGKGWVCFVSSGVIDIPAPAWPDDAPLWAEVVKVDDGESLHVRYVGPHWEATRLRRIDGSDGDGWIFVHRLARIHRGTLTYEVAWAEEVGVWRPSTARLAEMEVA